MKNLIDELHKLDEVEYKVSEDFSKRVMKNIKKSEKTNKFGNVISIVSAGLVACLAVFAFYNIDIKSNIFNSQKETNTDNIESEVNIAYFDSNDHVDKVEYSVENTNNALNRVDGTPEFVKEGEVASDSANIDNNADELKDTFETMLSGDEHQKLMKALKDANVEYELVEEGIKVNSTENDITGILNDFENIDIEIEGEYIILKEK